MFYVPKKEIKLKDVEKVLSAEDDDEWGIVDNGNNRDVDEYNRRVKVAPVNDVSATEEVNVEDVYDETLYIDDYNYSTRIVRFHNPTLVVVRNPWYWDYSPYYNYNAFWDSYWDYSWHYGGVNFNYCSGMYAPCYAAPLYSHPHHYSGVKRVTNARRIPVANAAKRTTGKRVPVANNQVNKKVGNERRNNNIGAGGKQVRENREKRNVRASRNENSDRGILRSSNSSTYNRKSSTGVNRGNSSRTESRTPVSRGGVSRAGRR